MGKKKINGYKEGDIAGDAAGGSCLEGLTPCQRFMSLSAPCQSRNIPMDKPYLYRIFSSRMWLVGSLCRKGESTERTASYRGIHRKKRGHKKQVAVEEKSKRHEGTKKGL